MPDLDTKTTSKESTPKVATPSSAPPEDKAKLLEKERIAEEEEKKQRAYIAKQRKKGKAKNKVKSGLAKVGLDSDIGDSDDDDDDELDTQIAKSKGGKATFKDGSDGLSFEDDDEDSDTEGLSLGASKDGIQAGGIELADGWSADFALGPGQQKAEFEAPTGLKFPPPDGFELDLIDIKIPIMTGVGLDITAGLEGGLTLDKVKLALEHKAAKSDVEQLDRFQVSGAGSVTGEFGVKVEIAMWGGVPYVATARAGLRAKAGAEAKLGFEAGGRYDLTRTVPVMGEKAKVTSKDGEIYLTLAGTGSVVASLSAFLGFQLFTFKGDLYELVIAKAAIANLEIGARFGVRYEKGKSKFFAEPIEKDYLNFDWLFGKLWKARKLDRAKTKATETQANLAALEDLKSRPDIDQYVKGLDDEFTFLQSADGGLQLLKNEEAALRDQIEADTRAIDFMMKEYVEVLLPKNEKVKKKRWKITNKLRGDIPDLKETEKFLKEANARLTKNSAKLADLHNNKRKAQSKFVKSLDPKDIDARIAAAKAKADDTFKENWKIFSAEIASLKKAFHKRWHELNDAIEKQQEIIEDKRRRIDDPDGGLVAYFQKLQDTAQLEETLKESEVTALLERKDKLQEKFEALSKKRKSGAEGKALKKQIAKSELEMKQAIAAWEKAHAHRIEVGKNNPMTALESQLAKAQSHKLLLEQRRAKLEEDARAETAEHGKLLEGTGVVRPGSPVKAAVDDAARKIFEGIGKKS